MDEIYGVPEPKAPPVMTHVWNSRSTHGERHGQKCFIEAIHGKKLFIRFEDGGWVFGTGGCLRTIKAM